MLSLDACEPVKDIAEEREEFPQLFVGGCHPETSRSSYFLILAEIYDHFKVFGDIEEVRLMKDKLTRNYLANP